MRLIYTFTLFLLFVASSNLSAQQEALQTQFMYNKLAFNPGYAGSFVSPTLTATNRSQWIGIEGAPNVQQINYVQPLLSNHFGLGFNLTRQSISINRAMTFELSYAYQMALPRGYLGIGLQASMRHWRQNWADERIVTSQPIAIDQAIPVEVRTKLVPNFGFGVYYNGPRWYAGVAIPRLVQNNLDFAELGGILSREVQHFNTMLGFTLRPNDEIEITPQALFRYVKNAPPDADINLNASYQNKFTAGITYRIGGEISQKGESLDVLAGIQATRNLMLLLSYDIGLTRLRRYSNGSIEATARWWFNPPEGDEVVNPNRPY